MSVISSRIRKRRFAFSSAVSAAAFLLYANPAFAQDTAAQAAAEPLPAEQAEMQAEESGDIVVTARLRSDRLLDVPVAVTAIAPAQLDKLGTIDHTRVPELVPGAVISRGSSGSGGMISVRGIASSPTNSAFEASVGINVDGITITRGYITQMQFFDVEQIEVLKGPQALFFGKNSPGGVIQIRTVGPGSHWEGYVRGGYEFNARERIVEGAVGGPISDTLGVRLAARYSEMDGYFYNRAGPIANPFDPSHPLPGAVGGRRGPQTSNLTARATVAYEPSDNFDATLKVLYNGFRDVELTSHQQAINCAAGNRHTTTLGVQDPFSDCKADRYRSSGFYSPLAYDSFPYLQDENGPFARNDMWLGSLQLNYDAGPLKLTSLTGYFNMDQVGFANVSFDVFARFGGINGETNKIFTQEFRGLTDLGGPVNLAGGVFYEDSRRNSFGLSRSVSIQGPDPRNGSDVTNWPVGQIDTLTKSAFVQAIVTPLEGVEATGGVRYTKVRQNADIRNIFVNQYILPGTTQILNYAFRPENDPLVGRYEDDNWSPEFTLSYKPVSDQTIYAAYKSGYKIGGISSTVVILRTDTIPNLTFQSEKANGAEVGYKAILFDRKLNLNLNGYYYKYKDLQRTTLDINTTAFLVRNAAAATVKGIELDAAYRITPEFTFTFAGAYNDATYDNFAGASCYNGQTDTQGCVAVPGTTARAQDLSGARLARAPKWIGQAGLRYDTDVSSDLGLEVATDLRYSSRYFLLDDNDPRGVQGQYAKVNLSTRLYTLDRKLEFTAAIRNLTNKYVSLYGSAKPGGAPGDIIGVVDRGREFALGVTTRF